MALIYCIGGLLVCLTLRFCFHKICHKLWPQCGIFQSEPTNIVNEAIELRTTSMSTANNIAPDSVSVSLDSASLPPPAYSTIFPFGVKEQ